MINIKYVFDKLDVSEFCLTMTGIYIPSETKLEQKENNDIVITIDDEEYTDIFYGREIQGKFYFARNQMINKNPDIDYYDEFFSNGTELKF